MFNLPKPQQIRWNQNALRGEEARQSMQIKDDSLEMQKARHRMMMTKARQAQAAQAAQRQRQEQQNSSMRQHLQNGALEGVTDTQRQFLMDNPNIARQMMVDRMKERLTPFNSGPAFKVPTGFMKSHDGNGVVPIPGGPKDLNSPHRLYTDGQVKSSSFAKRMKDSEGIMTPLEKEGYEYGGWQVTADYLGNWLNTDQGKKYKQAQEDWVRAKLRRESGAAIGVDEMRQEIELYFPKYGDTTEVIEQKRAAREAAMKNLMAESQGAYKRFHRGAEDPLENSKIPSEAREAAKRAIARGKPREQVLKVLKDKYGGAY